MSASAKGEIAVVIALERVAGAVRLVGIEFDAEAALEFGARPDRRPVDRERETEALGAMVPTVALDRLVDRVEVEQPQIFRPRQHPPQLIAA